MKKDKAAYQVYSEIIGSPDLSPGQPHATETK